MADERTKTETMNTRKRSHAIMTGAEDTDISHEDVSTHAHNSTPFQNTTNNQAQHTRTIRPFDHSSPITSPDNNTEAGHSPAAPSHHIDTFSRLIETTAEYPTAIGEDQDNSMIVDRDHHGLANTSVPEEGDQTTAVPGADHEGYDAEDEASTTSEEEGGEEQVKVELEGETEVEEEDEEKEEQANRPTAQGVSTYPFPPEQQLPTAYHPRQGLC